MPATALTRSVLLRSQPITTGDSTSDKEARNATAGESPAGTSLAGCAGPAGHPALHTTASTIHPERESRQRL